MEKAKPNYIQLEGDITLPSFRNKIINGAMDIWQRGTSFTPYISNGDHGPDRFRFFNSLSSAYTVVDQSTDLPNYEFTYSLKITPTTTDTASAGQEVGFRQAIEGYNFRSLFGKFVTLSFWVKSSATAVGTYCVALFNVPITRNYIMEFPVTTTWTKITKSFYIEPVGTWDFTNGYGCGVWFDLGSGSNYVGTPNVWLTSEKHCSSNQKNFFDNASNELYITGWQLEEGEIASEFEHRPYGMELQLCERYFRQISTFIGVANGSTSIHASIPLNPCMRIYNPNLSTSNPFNITDTYFSDHQSSATSPEWVNLIPTTFNGCRVGIYGFAGLTLGRVYMGVSNPTPHLSYIYCDAELQ